MECKHSNVAGDEEMAADKPLKPALQKPPAFSDQHNPPSGTAMPPRRHPRPIYPASLYLEEKKRRFNFCCCFCIFFSMISILLVIAVAVFFLWYNPKLPVVRLASFKISNFNFSSGKPDNGWSFLSANTTAVMDFINQNENLTFDYVDTDVTMFISERDFETNLGSTKVKGFIEKPGNRTVTIVLTRVRKLQVDDPTTKRLRVELQSKKLSIERYSQMRKS